MPSEQRFIRSIPMIIIFTTMFMFWLWLMSLCWYKQMSLINLCHAPFVKKNISPYRIIEPISPLPDYYKHLQPKPRITIIISLVPQNDIKSDDKLITLDNIYSVLKKY